MTVALDHKAPAAGESSWLRRRNIARFEVGCVSAFHLIVAVTMVAAPREQIVTPGTSAIFGTIPLPVWVIWFAATAGAAAVATGTGSPAWLSVTWTGVFPLGTAWIYGFAVAIGDGRGNALFPIAWSFLLIWWVILAVRVLGGTGVRWGGG